MEKYSEHEEARQSMRTRSPRMAFGPEFYSLQEKIYMRYYFLSKADENQAVESF